MKRSNKHTDPGSDHADQSGYRIQDPEVLAHNIARALEESGRALQGLLERGSNVKTQTNLMDDIGEIGQLFAQVAKNWMEQPERFAEAQAELMRGYTDLWTQSARRMNGEDAEPAVVPGPRDNRFRDKDWSENQYFDFLKQAYLITVRWAEDIVDKTDGIDPHTQHKARFYLEMLASALSPSNFPFTNPEVVRETIKSNGQNLLVGLSQLRHDLERSDDLLKIRQTDLDAFAVGKNLALTPGKVIFQNDLIQLIQYKPATKTAYARPLLIVPPWINKFYILDLVPEKSFIRYVVEQGFTVFVISWVNPDRKIAEKTFEDYMREGIHEATRVVREIAESKKINVLGYCVGGTLLGTTLAYGAATGQMPFSSATFLTTQLDFQEAGDLRVFVDKEQMQALEEKMAERGYLDGAEMANAFNMLRPRDLIWPYVVNNYLLGKKPFPFDLLYWNQDSARMPMTNHLFYLREFYHKNKLSTNRMKIGGVRLKLGRIDIPIYDLAAKEDHIAPAASVYRGAKLLGGKAVRYVLSGSGHIAGVINPPAKNKYRFWTSAGGIEPDTLSEWIDTADEHPGSWWPDWIAWLKTHSGDEVAARKPGKGPYKAIEKAPGSYVRKQS